MSQFTSTLAPVMEDYLEYREALGYLGKHSANILKNLDRFVASRCATCGTSTTDGEMLTKEIIMDWLSDQHGDIPKKGSVIRGFGEYLCSVGLQAYVLPRRMTGTPSRKSFAPYMFKDDELRRLFTAIDNFPASRYEPFLAEILPVMFRLNYTCGLRPNESRNLETKNVNLDTGEILITHTKQNKERLVVMSSDMLARCNDYNTKRLSFARSSKYFFPRWNGETFTGSYLHKCFTERWRLANPTVSSGSLPPVRVYNLRHSFATAVLVRWLESGADLQAKLPYLRAYMGHATFDETLYYVHLLPENFVKATGVNWGALTAVVPEVWNA